MRARLRVWVVSQPEEKRGGRPPLGERLAGPADVSVLLRHLIGLSFGFTPSENEKWVWVGDVLIDGLEPGFVHRWNDPQRGLLMLSPFKGIELWQFQFLPADGAPPLPEPDQDKFRRVWAAWTGLPAERLHGTRTASRFRTNEHVADHYRVGRVFLAGDAAHIYSAAGGQGMTTGVQDAYNLGWKLAAVFAGATHELLDTYEAERKPVAEYSMRRSRERWEQVNQAVAAQGDSPMWQLVINEDTSQLNVTYRGGPLAAVETEQGDALRPGDRAPDGVFQSAGSSEPIHLFDVFRGPHWTILLFGEQRDRPKLTNELWGAPMRTRQRLDHAGSYAFTADTALVVRPDGYIARITHPGNLTDSSSLLAINA
jgi:FAD binding domain